MTRREYITLITKVGLLSMIPFGGTLTSCVSDDEKQEKPKPFFNPDQALLISSVSETILPKTETLGALDVGVPHFIDLYIDHCYTLDKQDEFLGWVNSYIEYLKQQKIAFKLSNELLLKQLLADEVGEDEEKKKFVKEMKALTMKAYFSTEKAIKEHFNYVLVPGEYKGCFEPEENQKPWIN